MLLVPCPHLLRPSAGSWQAKLLTASTCICLPKGFLCWLLPSIQKCRDSMPLLYHLSTSDYWELTKHLDSLPLGRIVMRYMLYPSYWKYLVTHRGNFLETEVDFFSTCVYIFFGSIGD
jgi:hypothetical protein